MFVYASSHLTPPVIGVTFTGWKIFFEGGLMAGEPFWKALLLGWWLGGKGWGVQTKSPFAWVEFQTSSAQNNFYVTVVSFSGSLHGSRKI